MLGVDFLTYLHVDIHFSLILFSYVWTLLNMLVGLVISKLYGLEMRDTMLCDTLSSFIHVVITSKFTEPTHPLKICNTK
jgi:hypothetical protein